MIAFSTLIATSNKPLYLDKKNSNVAQTLYLHGVSTKLHVHKFEALSSVICRSISHSQVIKVLRHKILVLR